MAWIGRAWKMTQPSAMLEVTDLNIPDPGPGQAVIAIAGCGVCHTDVGFLHDGVKTRKPAPITLGHEISGTVLAAHEDALLASGEPLLRGQAVIVPAVLPCGECALCKAGRDNACLKQMMPGNDFDGGFATHITVPARFLVPVDDLPPGLELRHLAVVADAVSTPYQAMVRAGVGAGDHVVVLGAGGIGIYGVQIAAALGARVIAVDVSEARAARAREFGALAGVCTAGLDENDARVAVRAAAKGAGWPSVGWRIFEMSGHQNAQRLAYSLLNSAGTLAIVGFTREKVEVRLSNLMAFDAEAFGSWGCSPRHYPAAIQLIIDGKVRVDPFVEFHPLSEVNTVLERARHGALERRAVLVPED